MVRDNKYLENLLYDIWENHFCDVARLNLVTIKYGKHSKRQLGSIKLIKDSRTFDRYVKKYNLNKEVFENPTVSLITLTRYFSYDHIPEYVIKATIVHELCHYTHGFSSPLERIYKHPHRGGIIKKEFQKRELLEIYTNSKKWIKENWLKVIT
ncbi:hypothetical protein A2400_00150 [candidate division WS6 bacterium RIFOXYB1_FULL_33_14]|uniref:SprT-like domain-containing protein n=1 Tax=candidate division WS6 bacterium RIFOXYB1_FULL_33_14 TaxID=1817896 RepID=A0A1F4UH50_9BACT|nr:MAG: hypothetical protein A2400_00150 [candidate division WS6 bacterium RIFOXYB1_FULL_33_14]